MTPLKPHSSPNEGPSSRREFMRISTSNLLLSTAAIATGISAVLNARKARDLEGRLRHAEHAKEVADGKVRIYETPLLAERVRESILDVEVTTVSPQSQEVRLARSQGISIYSKDTGGVLYVPHFQSDGFAFPKSFKTILRNGKTVQVDASKEVPFFADWGWAIPLPIQNAGDPSATEHIGVYVPKPGEDNIPALFVSFPDLTDSKYSVAGVVRKHIVNDRGETKFLFSRTGNPDTEAHWRHSEGIIVNMDGDMIGFAAHANYNEGGVYLRATADEFTDAKKEEAKLSIQEHQRSLEFWASEAKKPRP